VKRTGSEAEEELSRREKDFLTYFGYLNDRLINHFSCACQSATDIILYHGRMFITDRYICFSSHIIKEYLKVIPFSDITNIVKKNTALVFSNAIGVTHKKGSEFFTSFLHRDKVFDLISTLWRKNKGEEKLGINIRSLIKQEQKAAKPQPDNSFPERKKSTGYTGSSDIPIEPNSPRDILPEVLQSVPSNVVIPNTTLKSPPNSPPTKTEQKDENQENQENPKDEELVSPVTKRTTSEHPLDLILLKSGKPKKNNSKTGSNNPRRNFT